MRATRASLQSECDILCGVNVDSCLDYGWCIGVCVGERYGECLGNGDDKETLKKQRFYARFTIVRQSTEQGKVLKQGG